MMAWVFMLWAFPAMCVGSNECEGSMCPAQRAVGSSLLQLGLQTQQSGDNIEPGDNIDKETFQKMFGLLDKNDDKQLDLDEFQKIKRMNFPGPRELTMGDFVSRTDVERVFRKHQEGSQLKSVFDVLDVDDDGYVTENESVKAIEPYHYLQKRGIANHTYDGKSVSLDQSAGPKEGPPPLPSHPAVWIKVKATDDPTGASTCEAACRAGGMRCDVASYRDEEVNELVSAKGDWNANRDKVVKILQPIAEAAGMTVDEQGSGLTACKIKVPQWHSPHVAPIHTLFTSPSGTYTLNLCFDGYRGKEGPPTCLRTMKSYYCAGFTSSDCERAENLYDDSGGINTEMFCPCK